MRTLILMVSTFLFAHAAFAEGGHDVGNGGDSVVIVIKQTAENIGKKWSALKPECAEKLPAGAQKFNETIKTAQIRTTQQPLFLVEGGEKVFKEAINYPKTQRVIFHRQSFQSSERKEQLVAHEFLGLSGIDDSNYEVSKNLMLLTSLSGCMSSAYKPIDACDIPKKDGDVVQTEDLSWPENLVPISSIVDAKGVVYFVDVNFEKLFVYDTNTNRRLRSIRTKVVPKFIVYSRRLNRIYLANPSGVITFIDLNQKNPSEKPFGKIPENIRSLATMGMNLLVTPEDSDWGFFRMFSPYGKIIQERDWSYPTEAVVPSPSEANAYYLSGFSPSDLHRIDIVAGEMKGRHDKDSPYHGDFTMFGPIVAGERFVAIGSGQIFSTSDLSLVETLPKPFSGGQWVKGRLLTVERGAYDFTVNKWNQRFKAIEQAERVEGVYVSLLQAQDQAVLIYLDSENRIQIRRNILNR